MPTETPPGFWQTSRPRVSDAVHYVSHGTPVQPDGSQAYASVCRAAIVAEVNDPAGINATLCVLNPTGLFFHDARHDEDVNEDRGHAPGTWHWPERS